MSDSDASYLILLEMKDLKLNINHFQFAEEEKTNLQRNCDMEMVLFYFLVKSTLQRGIFHALSFKPHANFLLCRRVAQPLSSYQEMLSSVSRKNSRQSGSFAFFGIAKGVIRLHFVWKSDGALSRYCNNFKPAAFSLSYEIRTESQSFYSHVLKHVEGDRFLSSPVSSGTNAANIAILKSFFQENQFPG